MDRVVDNISRRKLDESAIIAPVSGKKTTLSNKSLIHSIASVSRALETLPVRPRSIGILSNRNAETYVSILASYCLGIKFVPLNPKFPIDRLRTITALSNIDVILCDCAHENISVSLTENTIDTSALIIASQGTAAEDDARSRSLSSLYVTRSDTDIAYQMFTSGSTGEPKGVPISYGNLEAYLDGISSLIDFHPGEKFSQFFDVSFDLAMHDIFVCFATGGTLVAASDMDLMMPVRFVNKNRIDVWFSVPMLGMVANRDRAELDNSHKLRLALFCGEALPMETVVDFKKLMAASGQIWNLYGPTEATIAFTARNLNEVTEDHGVAPLGSAFGTNKIAVMTSAGEINDVRSGPVEGQLLLGGSQVFEGYNPDIDAGCFVHGGSDRYYKSGDLVNFDGRELRYRGRTDSQIKIRGFRVELGEIENAFRRTFGVKAVVAVAIPFEGSNQVCLAYVHDQVIDDVTPLSQHLPEYMIPRLVKRLTALPLNANGKVDRNKVGGEAWFAE